MSCWKPAARVSSSLSPFCDVPPRALRSSPAYALISSESCVRHRNKVRTYQIFSMRKSALDSSRTSGHATPGHRFSACLLVTTLTPTRDPGADTLPSLLVARFRAHLNTLKAAVHEVDARLDLFKGERTSWYDAFPSPTTPKLMENTVQRPSHKHGMDSVRMTSIPKCRTANPPMMIPTATRTVTTMTIHGRRRAHDSAHGSGELPPPPYPPSPCHLLNPSYRLSR